MNIFVTNTNPSISALYLDDKRVIKMILESTQMLCTALHVLGYTKEIPYKPTHVNHPCNIWVRESDANFIWLRMHALALCKEYTNRFGKRHKCMEVLAKIPFSLILDIKNIRRDPTPFVNCAANKSLGIDFKHIEDTCEAYRLYLSERWKHDKRRPTWFGKEHN